MTAWSCEAWPSSNARVVLDNERLLGYTLLTVTVQVAFAPLPSFAVQVMVAVPLPLAVTRPLELTVATLVLLLFQVTP